MVHYPIKCLIHVHFFCFANPYTHPNTQHSMASFHPMNALMDEIKTKLTDARIIPAGYSLPSWLFQQELVFTYGCVIGLRHARPEMYNTTFHIKFSLPHVCPDLTHIQVTLKRSTLLELSLYDGNAGEIIASEELQYVPSKFMHRRHGNLATQVVEELQRLLHIKHLCANYQTRHFNRLCKVLEEIHPELQPNRVEYDASTVGVVWLVGGKRLWIESRKMGIAFVNTEELDEETGEYKEFSSEPLFVFYANKE